MTFILREHALALPRDRADMLKLRASESGVQIRHAEIMSGDFVPVVTLAPQSVAAIKPRGCSKRIVVRRNKAPLSGCDRLRGVETESVDRAERSRRYARNTRSQRLGGILDHRNAAFASKSNDRFHLANIAIA